MFFWEKNNKRNGKKMYELKPYLALQYREIIEHRYYLSEKAGLDVGESGAVISWLQNHATRFNVAYMNNQSRIESACNNNCGSMSNCKGVRGCDLEMIVVHELSHFKEKEHNRAFYSLCEYMQPSYHQVEFDLRLYLTHIELVGKIDEWN